MNIMKKFTIATFNANSIRSRLQAILDWLHKHNPDVLAIQETKVQDADFPAAPVREAGYHAVFKGEKSYNGVALLSRAPAADVINGFDDGEPSDATRLIAARFGSVSIVNTYVPQGRDIEHEMFAYKLNWFARLKKFFAARFKPEQPVVWVGDLNVAPTPIDLHDPAGNEDHVCFHADVRAAFEKTAAWGFTDVFRMHHAEPGQYSFYDYRTINAIPRKMGWRVDHILATSPLARRCIACDIDLEPRRAEKPSDHTFVKALFNVES